MYSTQIILAQLSFFLLSLTKLSYQTYNKFSSKESHLKFQKNVNSDYFSWTPHTLPIQIRLTCEGCKDNRIDRNVSVNSFLSIAPPFKNVQIKSFSVCVSVREWILTFAQHWKLFQSQIAQLIDTIFTQNILFENSVHLEL